MSDPLSGSDHGVLMWMKSDVCSRVSGCEEAARLEAGSFLANDDPSGYLSPQACELLFFFS